MHSTPTTSVIATGSIHENLGSKLFHPSYRPAGDSITIGRPRFYELSAALFLGARRRCASRPLIAAVDVQPSNQVLDVGCGSRYFSRILAHAVPQAGSVVGSDAAPETTGSASWKPRRFSKSRLQPGAAESLAFPDVTFDVVAASLMLHHLPEEGSLWLMREMKRVLGPGGTPLLAEFRIPEPGAWRLVAALTGHMAMEPRVAALESLVANAGLTELRSGDMPAWLRFVRATNSRLQSRALGRAR